MKSPHVKTFDYRAVPAAWFDPISGKQLSAYDQIHCHFFAEIRKNGYIIPYRNTFVLDRSSEDQWDKDKVSPVTPQEYKKLEEKVRRSINRIVDYYVVEVGKDLVDDSI